MPQEEGIEGHQVGFGLPRAKDIQEARIVGGRGPLQEKALVLSVQKHRYGVIAIMQAQRPLEGSAAFYQL